MHNTEPQPPSGGKLLVVLVGAEHYKKHNPDVIVWTLRQANYASELPAGITCIAIARDLERPVWNLQILAERYKVQLDTLESETEVEKLAGAFGRGADERGGDMSTGVQQLIGELSPGEKVVILLRNPSHEEFGLQEGDDPFILIGESQAAKVPHGQANIRIPWKNVKLVIVVKPFNGPKASVFLRHAKNNSVHNIKKGVSRDELQRIIDVSQTPAEAPANHPAALEPGQSVAPQMSSPADQPALDGREFVPPPTGKLNMSQLVRTNKRSDLKPADFATWILAKWKESGDPRADEIDWHSLKALIYTVRGQDKERESSGRPASPPAGRGRTTNVGAPGKEPKAQLPSEGESWSYARWARENNLPSFSPTSNARFIVTEVAKHGIELPERSLRDAIKAYRKKVSGSVPQRNTAKPERVARPARKEQPSLQEQLLLLADYHARLAQDHTEKAAHLRKLAKEAQVLGEKVAGLEAEAKMLKELRPIASDLVRTLRLNDK